MQILFAISILCLFALLWAGFAIARAILRARTVPATAPAPASTQQIQTLFPASRAPLAPASTSSAVPVQDVHDIAARKTWSMPPATKRSFARHQPLPETQFAETHFADFLEGARKGPQSAIQSSTHAAHHGTAQRLDRQYYNEDLGDLTDPSYQPLPFRANSGARRTTYRSF